MKRLSTFSIFMLTLVPITLLSNAVEAAWYDVLSWDNAKKACTKVRENLVVLPTGIAGFIGMNTGYNSVDMLLDLYKNSPEFVKNFGGAFADKTGISIFSRIPVNPRYVGALAGMGCFGYATYERLTRKQEPVSKPQPVMVVHNSSGGSSLKTVFNGLSSIISTIATTNLGQCAAVAVIASLYHQYMISQPLVK